MRTSQLLIKLGFAITGVQWGAVRDILLCGTFSAALIYSPLALCQTPKKDSERKKTAVNFEDQLIQGELNKPDFFYFLQKKQFNFGRLIKLRENFLLEMKKTSEEIERKGGGS